MAKINLKQASGIDGKQAFILAPPVTIMELKGVEFMVLASEGKQRHYAPCYFGQTESGEQFYPSAKNMDKRIARGVDGYRYRHVIYNMYMDLCGPDATPEKRVFVAPFDSVLRYLAERGQGESVMLECPAMVDITDVSDMRREFSVCFGGPERSVRFQANSLQFGGLSRVPLVQHMNVVGAAVGENGILLTLDAQGDLPGYADKQATLRFSPSWGSLSLVACRVTGTTMELELAPSPTREEQASFLHHYLIEYCDGRQAIVRDNYVRLKSAGYVPYWVDGERE